MDRSNGPVLRLRGVKGFFAGEERTLRRGQEIVVGRSRKADLSLRNASRFVARPDHNELRGSNAYLSVSRRHVRIAFHRPDHVVIEDLSANGTYLDGKRVKGKLSLDDFPERGHVLGLGSVERLRLDLE